MQAERRNSFRCQVNTDERAAILATAKSEFAVRVLEKSAGGFGLLCDDPTGLEQEQIVKLTTSVGQYQVCIAHITEQDESYRIGAKILSELAYVRSEGGRKLGKTSNSSMGAIIAVLCLAFFGGGFLIPFLFQKSEKIAEALPAVKLPENRSIDFAESFLQFDALTSRQIMQRLNLRMEQENELNQIVDKTVTSLTIIHNHRHSNPDLPWQEMGMQLIQASWTKVNDVLDEDQRVVWEQLVNQAKTLEKTGRRS